MEQQEGIKSNSVLEFIRIAHEYCIFTESMSGKLMPEVVGFYQKLLPLVYLKAALLPQIEAESEDDFYERYVTEEHWENVFTDGKLIFGIDEHFFLLDGNGDTVKSSISESLADIYQELKDFIILFQNHRNAAKESALIAVRANFIDRWGFRITELLPQLHRLMYASELQNSAEEDLYN